MLNHRTLILAALLAAASTAQAAPEATVLDAVVVTPTAHYSVAQWQARQSAVLLDAVIVTPKARYSVAEWQSQQAARQVATVMLEPVIVTPTAHYTVAQWQQHQAGFAYAKNEAQPRGVQRWLKMVWKHFQFARTLIQA